MIFNDNLPIYTQIMNLIKKRIVVGELKGETNCHQLENYLQNLK